MPATKTRGRFVWYELYTSDPTAAQRFYPAITGWGTMPFEGAGMPYTMWVNGENPVGGMMQISPDMASRGVPPHWLLYVQTDDVDETVAEATQLGGATIMPPTDIPSMGRFAILKDPQGALVAVYKSAQDVPEPEFNPQRGDASWHELTTSDHTAAFDFYSKLFGWEKTSEVDMGEPAGMYLMYGRSGGPPLGGMWTKPQDMPVPTNWLVYFRVDDVDQSAEQVKQLGGQVINGPMDVPGGDRIVQCLDPQGAAFALHAPPKK